MEPIIIRIDKILKYLAETQTKEMLDSMRKKQTQKWMEEDKEETKVYYGFLAEWIAVKQLLKDGIKFKYDWRTKLYTGTDWDLIVGDDSIDVKGIPPDDDQKKYQNVLIQKRTIEKTKVGCFWPIKILDPEEAKLLPFIPKEEVLSWPVKNFGYQDAHYKAIQEIENEF